MSRRANDRTARRTGAHRSMARQAQSIVGLGACIIAATLLPAAPANAASLALCGNSGPAPASPQHVIVVMMENLSYKQVVGSSNAPYQTELASQCGVAIDDFGATHDSAANYLAVSSGEFPASSTQGCGSVSACADHSDSLYSQLTRTGLGWANFMESMPTPCDPTGAGPPVGHHTLYAIGHNPALFYTAIPAAECKANDLGVEDLTAQSGVFWDRLQAQTLPAFSFVSPNVADDDAGAGGGAAGEQVGDTWLQHFLATVQQSNSYQAGNTAVLITYDEGGSGSDETTGEDCTNKGLDLPVTNGVSAHQDSCHIPMFVVDPYTPAGDHDATFFDHYSLTKTVEQLFGLPLLAHAADSQTNSLIGSFGLTAEATQPPPSPPSVAITTPASGAKVSGPLPVSGTASASSAIDSVTVGVDEGTPQLAVGTQQWSVSVDTTTLSDGPHTVKVTATDADGLVGVASVDITVSNAAPPVDVAPVAFGSVSCVGLACSFDGSGSSDADGHVVSYAWSFGDGATGAGLSPSHSYASAGSYPYSLTVTDDQGVASQVFSATVSPSAPSAAVRFGVAAHAYVKTATVVSGAALNAPASVHAGDTELLFVSTPAVGATGTPAGWTRIGQQTSSPLQTSVFERTAIAADAGAKVTVPVVLAGAVALQLVDYSGVGSPISVTGGSDSNTASHVAPPGSVSTAGSWVMSYWSDKSSTTTGWALPSALTSRDLVVGTGGGHVSGAVADSGGPVAAGSTPTRTATVNGGDSGKGATLTLILPTQAGQNPPPVDVAPVAFGSVSCVGLACSFDGSGSSDADGHVVSYAWSFGDGATGAGLSPSHSYASAGSYPYSLTVTDDQGVASQVFSATVSPSAPSAAVRFGVAAHAYVKTATVVSGAALNAPASVHAGDTELLFVSTPAVGATGTPAGWTRIGQQTSSPLQTSVFERTAIAADAGAKVTVPVVLAGAVALQLVDYSGVGSPISVTGGSDSNTASHVAPPGSVSTAGSWVMSYWSDKSSTTTGWALPSALTSRDLVVGTGGGHVSGAVADSGGPVAAGSTPTRTATVNGGDSGKGATLTLILPPSA